MNNSEKDKVTRGYEKGICPYLVEKGKNKKKLKVLN